MLLITTGKSSGEAYRGEWGKVLSVVWWSLTPLVLAGSWGGCPPVHTALGPCSASGYGSELRKGPSSCLRELSFVMPCDFFFPCMLNSVLFAGESKKTVSLRCCIPRKASPKPSSVYFQQHFSADFPGHKDAGINSTFLPKVCVCWRHLFCDSVAF